MINLSLGGYTLDGAPPLLLARPWHGLLDGNDRVVVAAAGNDGLADQKFWPAAFAGADLDWAGQVVAVAAHDGKELYEWSNRGAWVTLAAPGADIVSTYVHRDNFGTGMAQWSGTSFAAPAVAAAIADPGTGGRFGAGRQRAAPQGRRGAGPGFAGYPGLA